MKSIATIAFVILVIVLMALMLVFFEVRQTELAIVLTFGKPTRQVVEPGWHRKWPYPIQRAVKFDSRSRPLEVEIGETETRGGEPIIVNTYVVWKVKQPLRFHNSVGTFREAENQLKGRIANAQNTVIGRHYFDEFVNSDPAKIKFRQIQEEMLESLRKPVLEDMGVEISTVGIKQLKISEDITEDVFDRIIARQDTRTKSIISEGESQAGRIRADADGKKTELLAAASARAKAIRGRGDAEAAKHYRMLEEDPKLAMLLRDLEALGKILKERSTVVLPADAEPFILLKEIPKLKPNEPAK